MRAAALHLALALLTLTACPGKKPLEAAPDAGREPRTVATRDAAPDAPPLPPIAPECEKLLLADACISVNSTGGAREPVDRDPWFKARGVTPPPSELPEYCSELTVGPSKEAALRCSRNTQPSSGKLNTIDYTFRVAASEVIYVVRARRVVVIFDKLVFFDAFDKEPPTKGTLFALTVDIPKAAEVITVSEPASGACTEARRRTAAATAEAMALKPDERIQTLAWARFDEQLVKRVCEATGRYVFKGGSFVRE